MGGDERNRAVPVTAGLCTSWCRCTSLRVAVSKSGIDWSETIQKVESHRAGFVQCKSDMQCLTCS